MQGILFDKSRNIPRNGTTDMRATEIVAEKSNLLKEVLALNGKINGEHWCCLLESVFTDASLYEQRSNSDLISAMTELQSEYANYIVGNSYLPLFVLVVGTIIQIMDVDGNIPPTSNARFLTVTGYSDESILFDNGVEWPNTRVTKLSYMTTILSETSEQYEQLRSYMLLAFGVDIPKEES